VSELHLDVDVPAERPIEHRTHALEVRDDVD
jgi:hypothetical protein